MYSTGAVGVKCFRTLLLDLESIGGLSEQVGSILILLLTATKKAEAASGALERLLCLRTAKVAMVSFDLSRLCFRRRGRGYPERTFCSRARGSWAMVSSYRS